MGRKKADGRRKRRRKGKERERGRGRSERSERRGKRRVLSALHPNMTCSSTLNMIVARGSEGQANNLRNA